MAPDDLIRCGRCEGPVCLDNATLVTSRHLLRRIRRMRQQIAAMDTRRDRAHRTATERYRDKKLAAIVFVAAAAADREARALDIRHNIATAETALEGDRLDCHGVYCAMAERESKRRWLNA